MEYFKICFKEYKYNEILTKDENISKISNFFATQKPIYLYDYLKNRSLKNSEKEQSILDSINEYNIDNNKTKSIKKIYPIARFCLEEDFYDRYEDIEDIEYIKLLEIFKFYSSINYGKNYYDDYKKNYSLKFKNEDMKLKLKIFSEDRWICSRFLIKLSDLKYKNSLISSFDKQFHKSISFNDTKNILKDIISNNNMNKKCISNISDNHIVLNKGLKVNNDIEGRFSTFEEIPQVKKRELNFLLNERNKKRQKFLDKINAGNKDLL